MDCKRRKRNATTDYKTKIESLPSILLTCIFIRLPLPSILDCREVCKWWNDIILESFFAEQQQSVSPLTLLVTDSSRPGFTRFGLVDLSRNRGYADYSLESAGYEIQTPHRRLSLIGSCNGLICLAVRVRSQTSRNDLFEVILFNPFVGKSLVLPHPPQVQGLGCLENFGFCYIPLTRQYKVVKIAYCYVSSDPELPTTSHQQLQRQPIFYVCTIESGSASPWTIIAHDNEGDDQKFGQSHTASDIRHSPAFLKGSLIWISDPGIGKRKSLIYFDIEKGTTKTFWLPSDLFKEPDKNIVCPDFTMVGIGVYYDEKEGEHRLYMKEDNELYSRIWVMEEWKSIDSLKLKWVIRAPEGVRVPVQILKVLRDGLVLLSLRDSVLVYFNPTTGTLEIIDIPRFKFFSGLALDVPCLLGCILPHARPQLNQIN